MGSGDPCGRLPAVGQTSGQSVNHPKPYFPLWHKGHQKSHSLSTCMPGTALAAENPKAAKTATNLDLYLSKMVEVKHDQKHGEGEGEAEGKGEGEGERGQGREQGVESSAAVRV